MFKFDQTPQDTQHLVNQISVRKNVELKFLHLKNVFMHKLGLAYYYNIAIFILLHYRLLRCTIHTAYHIRLTMLTGFASLHSAWKGLDQASLHLILSLHIIFGFAPRILQPERDWIKIVYI